MKPFGTLGVAAIAAHLAASPHITNAAVEPRSTSDLVTLLSGGPGGGGCSANERPIDTQVMSDGNHPFSIPPRRVLVLTGVEWSSSFTGPETSVTLEVFYRAPIGTLVIYFSTVQSTTAEYARGQSVIPNVVVTRGVPLCVTQSIDNGQARLPDRVILHGFLADDN